MYYDWWNASQTASAQTGLDVAKTMWDPCPAGYHVMSYTAAEALRNFKTKSASGTSLGIGSGYAVNFPAAGKRIPGNTVYATEFYSWLSTGIYNNNMRTASSFHGYTTNDSSSANYRKSEIVSYNRSQAHSVRCEKE